MPEKTLQQAFTELPDILKKLGYSGLRKGQEDAVYAVLHKKDCYCVLPTGAGKSSIFIIPTVLLDWTTIVFVPLVSLMQNHLDSVLRKGFKAGQLSSTQTPQENEQTLNEYINGNLSFLFVAPERLSNDAFTDALKENPPNMITIDEAHVASEHGLNFRPNYCKIADYIEIANPDVVMTLTATSPLEVEQDIIRIFKMGEDVNKVVYMPPRLNLHIQGVPWVSDHEFLQRINSYSGSGIIYCTTVKRVEDLYERLGHLIEGGCLTYHGQMSSNNKTSNQEMWMSGDTRVVICTNAFGLGIDKPDTRFVILRDIPSGLDELSQEIGRAGRDGEDAYCIVYKDPDSVKTQEFFIDTKYPAKEDIYAVYNVIKNSINSDGLCTLGGGKIAEQANVSKWVIQSVLANLVAFRVIERVNTEKVVQIKLLQEHADRTYKSLCDSIFEYGVINSSGFVEIDLGFLVNELGVKETTIKTKLSALAKNNYIEYLPPARSKPIKIIGPTTNIDMEYLKNKKKEAYHKLELVDTFYKVHDSKKHEFLTAYFNNEYRRQK